MEVPGSILGNSNVCFNFLLICVALALNTRKTENWQRKGVKCASRAKILSDTYCYALPSLKKVALYLYLYSNINNNTSNNNNNNSNSNNSNNDNSNNNSRTINNNNKKLLVFYTRTTEVQGILVTENDR